ncbi:TipAS antibiotic-recognition domain-containing protein [Peribacillus asahii]|uniref:TipAS antibiotic-recognition domain-containing protein n=1 Tax=Peribacillus asahii TaxID=228899 RepID=UPI00207A5308|nr:TipAS antibiotic-recognition domain-containing protein [Peribacillus asahii]USK68777.1 TipAS antibiotic-recognition domain-containing protein [Peribacillus asahii]
MYNISEEKQQELNLQAAGIFSELKQSYGQDPASENVQRLIQDYIDIAEEIFEDIIPFIQELVDKEIEIEDEPGLFPSPFSKEEEEWVAKAIELCLVKKGVNFNGNETVAEASI